MSAQHGPRAGILLVERRPSRQRRCEHAVAHAAEEKSGRGLRVFRVDAEGEGAVHRHARPRRLVAEPSAPVIRRGGAVREDVDRDVAVACHVRRSVVAERSGSGPVLLPHGNRGARAERARQVLVRQRRSAEDAVGDRDAAREGVRGTSEVRDTDVRPRAVVD